MADYKSFQELRLHGGIQHMASLSVSSGCEEGQNANSCLGIIDYPDEVPTVTPLGMEFAL